MVCEWGMSDAMGPLTFGKKEEQIFLGREIAQHQDYSEDTALKIDHEVKRSSPTNYQSCARAADGAQAKLGTDRRGAAGARSARRRAGEAPGRRPAARRPAAAAARRAVGADDEDEARPRQKERTTIVPALNKPIPQE
jgi:hypothetical protein